MVLRPLLLRTASQSQKCHNSRTPSRTAHGRESVGFPRGQAYFENVTAGRWWFVGHRLVTRLPFVWKNFKQPLGSRASTLKKRTCEDRPVFHTMPLVAVLLPSAYIDHTRSLPFPVAASYLARKNSSHQIRAVNTYFSSCHSD